MREQSNPRFEGPSTGWWPIVVSWIVGLGLFVGLVTVDYPLHVGGAVAVGLALWVLLSGRAPMISGRAAATVRRVRTPRAAARNAIRQSN